MSASSGDQQPIIVARGVHKAFGANVLFEGADFSVNPGETLAIIGESGSGKSVFLKMLVGLIEPDQGHISFKGEDIGNLDQEGLDRLRRQVGYVFQNDALFDSLTIMDNVGYALREHEHMPDAQMRERVQACLRMVNLQDRVIDLYPADLSGGMRKRVALARAIATEPEVLLYDEPTQGLDPQNITNIAEMIMALQRDLRVTSVVVTHDMRTAFTVADRITMLHERRFPFVGTPEELAGSEDPVIHEFIAEALAELKDAGGSVDASAPAGGPAPASGPRM